MASCFVSGCLSIFLIKSMIDYRSEISLWIATAPTLLLRAIERNVSPQLCRPDPLALWFAGQAAPSARQKARAHVTRNFSAPIAI